VIGPGKGTNVWFHDSHRYVVRLFPAIRNEASRKGPAERRIIQSVEIAARAESKFGLVVELMDARKVVSRGNFDFLAVVIGAGVLPAAVSSEIMRPVQLFPDFSDILNSITNFVPSSRCQVIGGHNAVMGLSGRLQGRCERQRTKNFNLIFPPAVAWSELFLRNRRSLWPFT
jgi:hypothetical protein